MSKYETIINDLTDLKRKAKNRRDSDSLDLAVVFINDAIHETNVFLDGQPVLDEKETNNINCQLADCYGILGGIYRRWGFRDNDPGSGKEKFKLSYESYDKGYELEKVNIPPNSYNMLNRLISRIFFNPEWLKSGSHENKEHFFLSEALQESEEAIELQLRTSRRRDIWALADLSMIKVLLGEKDPIAAFSNFVDESPPSYAYNSLLVTLKPLSELDIDPKESLKTAIHYIEMKIL